MFRRDRPLLCACIYKDMLQTLCTTPQNSSVSMRSECYYELLDRARQLRRIELHHRCVRLV